EPRQQSQVTTQLLREERAVGALAQRFTYQNVEEIPAGVNPKQLVFLRDASNIGAFMRIKPETARLITEYFTTEATYNDLAAQYKLHFASVQQRIFRGLEKLHTVLHQKNPLLAGDNTYPLEEIKKGKDVLAVQRSERGRARARKAREQVLVLMR